MQAGSGAEARIALFQERPHALALVGCAEQIQEEPTLPRDALRTGRDECGSMAALAAASACRGPRANARAASTAVGNTSAAGTTRSAMPRRRASSARTRRPE